MLRVHEVAEDYIMIAVGLANCLTCVHVRFDSHLTVEETQCFYISICERFNLHKCSRHLMVEHGKKSLVLIALDLESAECPTNLKHCVSALE